MLRAHGHFFRARSGTVLVVAIRRHFFSSSPCDRKCALVGGPAALGIGARHRVSSRDGAK